MKSARLNILLILSVVFSRQLQAQTATFKNNDRICFIGNSITYMGGYHHNIALYYATRFPQEKISVFNCGIGGNVAANVIARMDSDILINKPNWAAVKLGMNDVRKDLYTKEAAAKPNIQQLRQEALDVYRKNYEQIIQTLLQKNCKVILQTPSVYDETAALADVRLPGRNNALQTCAGYVKELGAKYKLPVVDYWTILNTLTQQVQSKDSTATLIGADRVHPGAVGHFIMAYEFLKTTVGSSVVSAVTIDASGKNGSAAGRNSKVTGLRVNEKGVQFTLLENALPFPVAKDAGNALSLVPFSNELNREEIIVKKLAQGRYTLLIDGKPAGAYTDAEFTAGVNLAQNAGTPQFQQAQQVLSLFQQYWQIEAPYRNMRGLEFGRLRAKGIITLADAEKYFDNQAKIATDTASVAYKDLQGYLKTYLPNKKKEKEMLEKMDQLHTAIYQASQPAPHQYQIIKEDDAVAASQAGASPLLFDPGVVVNETPPSVFKDEKELNSRNGLPGFFNKAKAGKPLTIAFMGGSVTQMDNKYRNQAARYIQRLFPGNKIRFVNAGVSGSGTDVGACRLEEHVLQYHPDLVFVEFAVNGSYLPGMEGIIRKIRKKDSSTGICLLYSIMSGQSELYAKGEVPDNITKLETVAAYYQLPSIQMGIEPSFLEAQGKLAFKGDANVIKDRIIFSDGIHPTEAGGYIYASAIYRSLQKMKEQAVEKNDVLPAPMIADNWEDAQMLTTDQVSFSEGWSKTATANEANLKQFTPWFPFVMRSEKPGASFSFSFTGSKIGVFDIGGPEVGQLELIVDGKKLKPLNRFNSWCNNRYRGQFDFVEVGAGTHYVMCTVSSDIPDKKLILGPSKIADITANPAKYNHGVIYLGRILIRGKLVKT